MSFSHIPIWKEAPFIRLFIPFSAGILIQWYFNLPVVTGAYGAITSLILISLLSLRTITDRFRTYWVYGILINCLLFFGGLLLTFFKDEANNRAWIARSYTNGAALIATIDEPLIQKPNSFKAVSSVQMTETKDTLLNLRGKIIIYFQRDSLKPQLVYGSKILFEKTLQPITNNGNPGSFDYKQYSAFQNIYYQVYLTSAEYIILPAVKQTGFSQFVFRTRGTIVSLLRKYIPGPKEAGLGEALLIGYRDDLDKELVRSYSNTGVVHIIAISGLHVGLIYWLLKTFLILFNKRKKIKWLHPVLVTAGLWLFSLLAGGSPSVLRSAVMFTFIIFGENLSRRTSVYNSLAASAFLLLCYNPFWLWDVGFQLSYAAVLSIVTFMKPVYNSWFIKNKILDGIWKVNAVTLSAQPLTVPICLYYFHQFPSFFLITNLVAVPLSSVILVMELLLCLAFSFPGLAQLIGWTSYWLIRMMNSFIEYMDSLPFSVIEDIRITLLQTFSLYAIIILLALWLLNKWKAAFIGALSGILFFTTIRCHDLIVTTYLQRLVVYNIPNRHAIDFIDGGKYVFKGDSILTQMESLKNFYLKASRLQHGIKPADSLMSLSCYGSLFYFCGKSIVVVKDSPSKIAPGKKIAIDIIIVSKNQKSSISEINQLFSCKQIIFDSSNSPRKIAKWKEECNQLGIPYYSVPEKGAFVMNMN
jgi:competence protein ComEC